MLPLFPQTNNVYNMDNRTLKFDTLVILILWKLCDPHIRIITWGTTLEKKVTFNWVKTWAAALKSHALSCRHLHRRVEIIQIKWLNCQVVSSAADIKSLTSGTIPGSCQTSVRKLWAYLAVTPLVSGQGWKMESGQEPQRLGGSPLSLPFEWKAGRWQCTDCCTETGG